MTYKEFKEIAETLGIEDSDELKMQVYNKDGEEVKVEFDIIQSQDGEQRQFIIMED